jgi:ribonucleoside-diphosphate reductase alpha chain
VVNLDSQPTVEGPSSGASGLAVSRLRQCPKCGEAALAFQEGCATCLACGHSTCS